MKDKITVRNLFVHYGNFEALRKINQILKRKRFPLIGPSGRGKSTLLGTLNRMNDLINGVKN